MKKRFMNFQKFPKTFLKNMPEFFFLNKKIHEEYVLKFLKNVELT